MDVIINQYIMLIIVIAIIYIALTWLFIKSAVKYGTKEALTEYFKEINNTKSNL